MGAFGSDNTTQEMTKKPFGGDFLGGLSGFSEEEAFKNLKKKWMDNNYLQISTGPFKDENLGVGRFRDMNKNQVKYWLDITYPREYDRRIKNKDWSGTKQRVINRYDKLFKEFQDMAVRRFNEAKKAEELIDSFGNDSGNSGGNQGGGNQGGGSQPINQGGGSAPVNTAGFSIKKLIPKTPMGKVLAGLTVAGIGYVGYNRFIADKPKKNQPKKTGKLSGVKAPVVDLS